MNNVLTMRDVRKRYGKRQALDGVDLNVAAGSILGLVGSNGAGKTTTMAIIAGFVRKDSGSVDVFGQGEYRSADHSGRMTVMPQDAALPSDACVGDLMTYYAELQGMSRGKARANAAEVINKVNLGDRITSTVRSLSHGMRQRVVLAQAFLGNPELILLDEPLSGLDPKEVVHIRDFIKSMRGRKTIIVSSHNLHEIELMCDSVAFLEEGRMVRQDSLGDITRNDCVVKYRLASTPDDISAISGAIANIEIELNQDGDHCVMVCRYDGSQTKVDSVNESIINLLFEQHVGLIDVQLGDGLEDAYIKLGRV